MMKRVRNFLTALLAASRSSLAYQGSQLNKPIKRDDALASMTSTLVATGSAFFANPIQQASARGRATLDYAYDRYIPRITEGGKYYKSTLYGAIAKSDWKALETATSEPPRKTKADRSLEDGGAAKRAALAGAFSDSRVLVAMDLFAATFSDSSISPKTKAMQAEVEKLREVVAGLNKAARLALGEEKSATGVFGIGAKGPSQDDLMKQVKELYLKGGNAYNQYAYLANDGLPVQLQKLPFI